MNSTPIHTRYLNMLRMMTPDQRLARSSKLTERARALLRIKLKASNPVLTDEQLNSLLAWRWLEMSEDTPPAILSHLKKHCYQIS